MPRKESINTKDFDDEVARCFAIKRGGGTVTTQDERRQIALDWLRGDHEGYVEIASERGLLPIALITACLLDVEHPLIVSPRGTLLQRSLLGAAVRILQVETTKEVVHIHDELVHSPCVQVDVVHRQEEYADA